MTISRHGNWTQMWVLGIQFLLLTSYLSVTIFTIYCKDTEFTVFTIFTGSALYIRFTSYLLCTSSTIFIGYTHHIHCRSIFSLFIIYTAITTV